MEIAIRHIMFHDNISRIVKGAYIRSVNGNLCYAIENASPGFGHYVIQWCGSVAEGNPTAGNDWTGPLGVNGYLTSSDEWFRWYVTGPQYSTTWQNGFWSAGSNFQRSSCAAVYGGDGSSKYGWIVLDQDITHGSNKRSTIYCGQTLDSLIQVHTDTATINATSIPNVCYGIFGCIGTNYIPPTSFSDITAITILPAGSRFFNFKLLKDDILLHDCYPVLNDNDQPAIYDIVTKSYAYSVFDGQAEYVAPLN